MRNLLWWHKGHDKLQKLQMSSRRIAPKCVRSTKGAQWRTMCHHIWWSVDMICYDHAVRGKSIFELKNICSDKHRVFEIWNVSQFLWEMYNRIWWNVDTTRCDHRACGAEHLVAVERAQPSTGLGIQEQKRLISDDIFAYLNIVLNLFWSASISINPSLENAGNARMQHIILLKENVLHLSYVSPSVQRRHIMVVCFVSILQKPWLSLYISQLYPPKKWKRGTAESRLVCTFFWRHVPAPVIPLQCSCYPCYPRLALAFTSSPPTGFVSSTSVTSRFNALYSILACYKVFYYSLVPFIHPIPCFPVS